MRELGTHELDEQLAEQLPARELMGGCCKRPAPCGNGSQGGDGPRGNVYGNGNGAGNGSGTGNGILNIGNGNGNGIGNGSNIHVNVGGGEVIR